MLPICSAVGERPFLSRKRSSQCSVAVTCRPTSFISVSRALGASEGIAENRLQPAEDAVSESKSKHRADRADSPRGGVLDAAEIKEVLIHPDQVTERIEIEHRAKHRWHPLRQIGYWRDIHADVGEHIHEVLDVAEEYRERTEEKGEPDDCQEVNGCRNRQQ